MSTNETNQVTEAIPPMTKDALREELLQEKIRVERVLLPNGKSVFVKEMDSMELDAFEASVIRTSGSGKKKQVEFDPINARAKLIIATCCNAGGELLFHSRDLEKVGRLPAGIATAIYKKAQQMNGLSEVQQDEDSVVDELAKNSEADSTAISS